MNSAQKTLALLLKLTDELRQAFLDVISNVVDAVMLGELTDAINQGNYERVIAILDLVPGKFRPFNAALERTFEMFAENKASQFPPRIKTDFGTVQFHFDFRNPRVDDWLKNKSSDLISRTTDDIRSNVRNIMFEGSGRNPRDVALDIVGRYDPATGKRTGGIIGLTKNQERWVASARRKLENLDPTYLDMTLRDKRFDSIVQKAIDKGEPLSRDNIEKLVVRYKDRTLKHRGDNIARTEIAQAQNQAEWESVKQGVDQGLINPQAVERTWDTAHDNRVRSSHRAMQGQVRALDEPFVTPTGHLLMQPGDTKLGATADDIVDCRCRAVTRVDWKFGLRENG